jgi:hypothetical protein
VWISEQTAIISPYNINWLVFVTEMESVYCAVRTECLNVKKEVWAWFFNITVFTVYDVWPAYELLSN